MHPKILFFFFSMALVYGGFAQRDTTSLLAGLDEEPTSEYVRNAFKTNRVINSHSIDNTAAGVLDFKVSHRFGYLNDVYNMFGLDQASMRIGGDYGITERLQVGVGRSTYNKTYDGYAKYKILWQKSGAKAMPISLCWISGMSIFSAKATNYENVSSRTSYFHQVLIGRKFSKDFTLQLAPTLVHRNQVATKAEKNDVFALGMGGRYKVAQHVAITLDYYYVFPNQLAAGYRNSVGVGVDIETGGHVFQLQFTNSKPMQEAGFITETTGNFFNGDISLGFNISRVFTIVRPN